MTAIFFLYLRDLKMWIMNRTLPLSVSGVLLGVALAAADYHVDWKAALFILLATICLHLYSGFSKGDPEKGKIWTPVSLALTVVCGLAMLHFSFGTIFLMEPLVLIAFGYMIIRAVKHTTFISRGKGILYIFMLFGLVAVYGSYFVTSHTFGTWLLIFPAVAVGLLSIAAKADSDKRIFRIALTAAGFACMTAYACLRMFDPWHFLYLLSIPVFFTKRLDWATFTFAILAGGGFLAYLIK